MFLIIPKTSKHPQPPRIRGVIYNLATDSRQIAQSRAQEHTLTIDLRIQSSTAYIYLLFSGTRVYEILDRERIL